MDYNRIDKGLRQIIEHVPQLNIPHHDFKNNPQMVRAQRSASIQKIKKQPPQDIVVNDLLINGLTEIHQVKLRVYTPKNASNAPVILYFHSGGFTVGEPAQMDNIFFKMLAEINYIIVAVDYRKAPENPFPAAIDDAYATLLWLGNSAEQILPINKSKIVVAGASAGGNIAAALTLMSRDKQGPKISFQMLLYPAITPNTNTNSKKEFIDSPVWDSINSNIAWEHYLGTQALQQLDAISPYANLFNANSLENLPPAYIVACGLDPLRDEAIDYAKALLNAKVAVQLEVLPAAIHVFDAFPCKLTTQFIAQQIVVLKGIF